MRARKDMKARPIQGDRSAEQTFSHLQVSKINTSVPKTQDAGINSIKLLNKIKVKIAIQLHLPVFLEKYLIVQNIQSLPKNSNKVADTIQKKKSN